jgi:hypothetical protein
MHAELVSGSTQPKILLRTRILLRDAYQRQGENIITWCEPYYDNSNNSNNDNSTSSNNTNNNTNNSNANSNGNGGVDLALSFQDNAGCLDIWKQITHVQRRAAELYRTSDQQQQSTSQSSSQAQQQQNSDQLPSDSDDCNKTNQSQNPAAQSENDANSGHSTITDMAQKVAADHHAELERQQQHQMWVSMAETVQRNSQPGSYADEDDGEGGGPLSQHSAAQHNAQHHAHHHGRGANNASNQNRQQQAGDAQQQQQQQHIQFVSAEDGGGELSTYGNSGLSSPNHQSEQLNLSNNNQSNSMLQPQLPNPPALTNLEEIADTIARVQVSNTN